MALPKTESPAQILLFRSPWESRFRQTGNRSKNTIVPLYSSMLHEERGHKNGQQALAAGFDFLSNFLKSRNTTYDALIFSSL